MTDTKTIGTRNQSKDGRYRHVYIPLSEGTMEKHSLDRHTGHVTSVVSTKSGDHYFSGTDIPTFNKKWDQARDLD